MLALVCLHPWAGLLHRVERGGLWWLAFWQLHDGVFLGHVSKEPRSGKGREGYLGGIGFPKNETCQLERGLGCVWCHRGSSRGRLLPLRGGARVHVQVGFLRLGVGVGGRYA